MNGNSDWKCTRTSISSLPTYSTKANLINPPNTTSHAHTNVESIWRFNCTHHVPCTCRIHRAHRRQGISSLTCASNLEAQEPEHEVSHSSSHTDRQHCVPIESHQKRNRSRSRAVPTACCCSRSPMSNNNAAWSDSSCAHPPFRLNNSLAPPAAATTTATATAPPQVLLFCCTMSPSSCGAVSGHKSHTGRCWSTAQSSNNRVNRVGPVQIPRPIHSRTDYHWWATLLAQDRAASEPEPEPPRTAIVRFRPTPQSPRDRFTTFAPGAAQSRKMDGG